MCPRWPAIIGIVVGSLIVLSLLFCLVQCLCCGYSCMQALCCCCKCGRGGSRQRSSRYKDDYSQMPATPYNGYQPPPASMMYSGPQTATFDSGNKKVNEDSLPAMPSWDNARTHHVEDEHKIHDLEMGRLNAPQAPQSRMSRGSGYNQVPQGPMSPTAPAYGPAAAGYFNQQQGMHSQSDLGSQRMGAGQQYSDLQHQPLSPAPTYRTNPQTANSDRFAPGATSPSPYQYQNQSQHNFSDAQTNYAPSTSTRYEATDYAPTYRTSVSPPPQQQYHQSFNHSTSPPPISISPPGMSGGYQAFGGQPAVDARPPSLLQVGRKAVPGSRREV